MLDTNKTDKSKKEKITSPPTKIVIRHLPPNFTKEEFEQIISPIPDHDYFTFCSAEKSVIGHCYSRAYINFKNPVDIFSFKEKFDGYVFVDQTGNESSAQVEYAPFQSIFKKNEDGIPKEKKCGTLEEDEDYLAFLATFENKEPVSVMGTDKMLEEINKLEIQLKEQEKQKTPLLQYVEERKTERIRGYDYLSSKSGLTRKMKRLLLRAERAKMREKSLLSLESSHKSYNKNSYKKLTYSNEKDGKIPEYLQKAHERYNKVMEENYLDKRARRTLRRTMEREEKKKWLDRMVEEENAALMDEKKNASTSEVSGNHQRETIVISNSKIKENRSYMYDYSSDDEDNNFKDFLESKSKKEKDLQHKEKSPSKYTSAKEKQITKGKRYSVVKRDFNKTNVDKDELDSCDESQQPLNLTDNLKDSHKTSQSKNEAKEDVVDDCSFSTGGYQADQDLSSHYSDLTQSTTDISLTTKTNEEVPKLNELDEKKSTTDDTSQISNEKNETSKEEIKDETNDAQVERKKNDPRAERKIRNKDRPTMQLYRPGQSRLNRLSSKVDEKNCASSKSVVKSISVEQSSADSSRSNSTTPTPELEKPEKTNTLVKRDSAESKNRNPKNNGKPFVESNEERSSYSQKNYRGGKSYASSRAPRSFSNKSFSRKEEREAGSSNKEDVNTATKVQGKRYSRIRTKPSSAEGDD